MAATATNEQLTRHVLIIIVENEPGVLARVIGLVAGRGYNIESLTVSAVTQDHQISRINMVTRGNPQIVDQIKAQLMRLVPVHTVSDLSLDRNHIERESMLMKVTASGPQRREALRLANIYKAKVVDASLDAFTFFLTGSIEKLDGFTTMMDALGKIEVARSGIIAMSRSAKQKTEQQSKVAAARAAKPVAANSSRSIT